MCLTRDDQQLIQGVVQGPEIRSPVGVTKSSLEREQPRENLNAIIWFDFGCCNGKSIRDLSRHLFDLADKGAERCAKDGNNDEAQFE